MSSCPKCQYQRQASDVRVMKGVCPNCGIAYNKWKSPEFNTPPKQKPQGPTTLNVEPNFSLYQKLQHAFLSTPERVDSISFWGRAILAALFGVWGVSFIWGGIDWEGIGGSFLHNVNLPFHEFGHVLFSPFGHFMMFLGGSLFQVLMPLGIMLGFTFKQKDNFAASIMLWWSGQNFIDISPYINDAPYRALPLILGMGEDAHDWGNILTMTNNLEAASTIANCSFLLGSTLIIIALTWSFYLLIKMKSTIIE